MLEEKYLTPKETSKFLKISISTMNRLIKQNRIPSYKVDKDELVEWVRNQRSESQVNGCGIKRLYQKQKAKSLKA